MIMILFRSYLGKFMKLKTVLKLLSIPVFLYSFLLLTIYLDIYDKRPILSLIKNIQSNSAIEIVDFSVPKTI
jgi:hypothetical protein